jgi:hypothetical protein
MCVLVYLAQLGELGFYEYAVNTRLCSITISILRKSTKIDIK